MESSIFVYYNDEERKVKVLPLSQAKEMNDDLLANGWKHTATLDPCKYIEYLFNETEWKEKKQIKAALKSLFKDLEGAIK